MPAQCCKDKWPTILEDEPVFVLRAQDLFAPAAVAYWLNTARANGVNQDKCLKVEEHLIAMLDFQRAYPERCKIPD